MKIFKSKRDKVREFLKGKDWQSLDEIALGSEMGRGSAKQTLSGLKKEVEFKDDKWKLIDIPPNEPDTETLEEIPPQNAISTQVPTPESSQENGEVQHQGLTAKMDDIQTQLNRVLGMQEKKEKKARLKKFSLSKLKRYNKKKNRAVIFMGSDQSLKLVKGEYFEGFKILKLGKNYYKAGATYTWLWEGKQPCQIIPEWSLEPIAADPLYQKAKESNTLIDAQLATIQAAKMIEQEAEGADKKKMGKGMWIGIAVAGIVVAWLFFGGQKK